MMMNILLYPSGSLVAQEIYDALKFEKNLTLYGTDYDMNNFSSFYFENYIEGCPIINNTNKEIVLSFLQDIVLKYSIKYIFPTFDGVMEFLKENEERIGTKILLPDISTIKVCNSKKDTYLRFKNLLNVPIVYSKHDIEAYPVYIKPIRGYGSRDHKIIHNPEDIKPLDLSKYIITEYLTGDEFTIDCFTNKNGDVLAVIPRQRLRTVNGLSISSKTIELTDAKHMANIISTKLNMRGAWFFQVKFDSFGNLKLLEIAPRIPGSMCTSRMNGINFPLLTILDQNGDNVDILNKNMCIHSFKIFKNYYKIDLDFNQIYCDLDDTIVIKNKINVDMIKLLYTFIDQNKKITIITRNDNAIEYMKTFRLNLYDEIIYVPKSDKKSKYIVNRNCIFIDDSYSERKDVHEAIGCYTFSPSEIELFNFANKQ